MKKIIIVLLFSISYLAVKAEWELIKEGAITTIALENDILYVGTENGLFISSDNGDTWEESGIYGAWISNIEFNANYLLVFGYVKEEQLSYLYLSSDKGETWTTKLRPHGTTVLVVEDEIFLSSDGIRKSTDMGETWEKVGPVRVTTIAYHNGVIYAGTDGAQFYENNIYISKDKGETWEYKNFGLRNDDIHFHTYTHLYSKSDSIFLGGNFDGLYVTTNENNKWTKVSDVFGRFFIFWKDLLFCSIGKNFYISEDYGVTLHKNKFDPIDILFGFVSKIIINDNTIFLLLDIGSSGPNRLYRASLDHITNVQDQVIKTDEYEINLYPNPASNVLNFNFVSKMNYDVSVSIYDILGKKVIELPQSKYGYGINSERIDISGLTNGTYTFVINVNGTSHSKLFTVLRG